MTIPPDTIVVVVGVVVGVVVVVSHTPGFWC
jgi:preprotein translocase subunit Sec61beta